ncbi:MAG: histidine phosphatase family protein [Desulfovibrionaceae bacterium]|nr:histidine phosphatase family protein [Desulfovibrionaceae bacterium]
MPSPLVMPPRSGRLYFLRHGQTEWNARRLFQGQTDIPLNDTGRAQAREYAALVRGWFATRDLAPAFSMAAVSPLARARETAEIVLADLGEGQNAKVPAPAEIRLEPGLMEQQYGHWEGLPIDEIRRRFPGSVEKQFASMRTFTADGGEPLQHMQERVLECVARLPDEALIVGHFGTLFSIMLAMWPGEHSSFPEIPQHAFFVIENGRILRSDAQCPEGREIRPQ